jgi:hypothetical protein
MGGLLSLFIVLEVPVLFLYTGAVLLLRRRPPRHWLPKLLALEFPLLAVGAIGLPLWALFAVLATAR